MKKIDWYYFRKGWTSCKRAQEVLEPKQVEVEETIYANKERFDEEAVWAMIKDAKKIFTAKGKKIEEWNPKTDSKEDILKKAIGPSGNLRAPTVKIQDHFYVGFNPDMYEDMLN